MLLATRRPPPGVLSIRSPRTGGGPDLFDETKAEIRLRLETGVSGTLDMC